eukprot:tig00000525_g1952.t1
MGAGSSSDAIQDSDVLREFVSAKHRPLNDPFWDQVVNFKVSFSSQTSPWELRSALRVLCERLVSNNVSSKNLEVLGQVLINQLRSTQATSPPESIQKAINTVWLFRTFSQHIIETLDHPDGAAHFGLRLPITSLSGSSEKQPFAFELVEALMAFLGSAEITDVTYVLHIEVLNLLLVLASSQLFHPISSTTPNLFLDILCRGITRTVTSAATTLLLLPYFAYHYFFPPKKESELHSLAERSLHLLLVAVHYRPDDVGDNNPFIHAIKALQDSYVPEDVEEGTAASGSRISFSALYESIGMYLHDEKVTLLTYCFIHSNPLFLAFCLARTDLDTLIIPILKMLHGAANRKANQIYMLLIVLLILSQDASFSSSVHLVEIAAVPWFKDRILTQVSLGSLCVIILVRTIQYNLTKLKDTYLHTNCLATLANMSPHFNNLHSYAAQRILVLFSMLASKYQKLSTRIATLGQQHPSAASQSVQDTSSETMDVDELNSEQMVFLDFLRIVLETINATLTFALPRNPHFVYAMLQRAKEFESFRAHPRLYDLIENVEAVLGFINQRLEEANLQTPWSVSEVMHVIEQAGRSWKSDRLRMFPELRFCYEEEAHPQEFFTPYVWSIVFHGANIPFDPVRVVIFSSQDGSEEIDEDDVKE